MATATVEIDMAIIPSCELVEEVCDRLRRYTTYGEVLTKSQKQNIYDDFLPLAKEFQIIARNPIVPITLDDVQKLEYLSKVFDRYSLNELMNLLPDKGFKK